MKKVWISIINYNGKKNTLDCLKTLDLIESNDIDLTIVVLDNNSKEKFEIPKNLLKNYTPLIVRSSENLGFAGGHNMVIQKAIEENAEYILVLNNDTIVDKNFLEILVETAQKNEKAGVIAPKIYFAKGYEYRKDTYSENELGKIIWYAGGQMDWDNVLGSHRGVDEVDSGQYDKEEETDFASGCCMLINAGVLKKTHGFDERYFLYYEDNELQERVKRLGFKIIFSPKAIIWHKNAGSVGGSGSSLQDYFITRNRMLFGLTHAPTRARFALIRESFYLLLLGRKFQKQGIIDFYLGKLGKGSFHE